MSAAEPLDPEPADAGALVLAVLGDDALSVRAIWALSGLPHAVLDPALRELEASGKVTRIKGAVPAFRRAAEPAPFLADFGCGPGVDPEAAANSPMALAELTRLPAGVERLEEAADRRLVRACLASGGLPRVITFEGRTLWLGPDNRPWRPGVPVGRPA